MLSIEDSWKVRLQEETRKEYFKNLSDFVKHEYKTETVYPHPRYIFRAFDLCPFDSVRVVILGQDPYHGQGQANGLSFAVQSGVHLPPSLQNIFKEIEGDIGVVPYQDGDLSRWAQQGVLLLNSTLTVRKGEAGSHQKKGWEVFTDKIIEILSQEKEHVVFILWGNYAKEKGKIIDRSKHCVIESAHPSPFSVYHGFFGSKPFSQANDYLMAQGKGIIDWR